MREELQVGNKGTKCCSCGNRVEYITKCCPHCGSDVVKLYDIATNTLSDSEIQRAKEIPPIAIETFDEVHRPVGYCSGKIQPVEYIDANNLGYYEGNIVKYITRWEKKGTPVKDLEKAAWYLNHLIKLAKDRYDARTNGSGVEGNSSFSEQVKRTT
jgi:hypothetical protein